MSYCEDYIDPFDREPDDDDGEYDVYAGDDMWECAFPGECLMSGEHLRCECFTVEDAEEMDGGV
jgi:hypothetical protein